jgi:hypothetical protein
MKAVLYLIYILLFSNGILSQSFFYSFENTYSGWDTTGIDLQLGDTTIAWSIHPSFELAIDSSYSMQYFLENYNDAGKIWIQRPFYVEQHKNYIVTIDYKFASRDFGMANLWTIITGVHLSPPTNAQELLYQGHTGNGFNFDTGYVWLDKNYEFNINSDTSNNLWIVIGIWGNWEVARTYYIDSLSIHIQVDNPNDLQDDGGFVPDYYLHQNYPNPFNPSTSISYSISERAFVTLKVYDVLGNEIAILVNEEKTIGNYKVDFDASGLPSGIYFYRLQAGSFVETKKMVLMR